MSIQYILDLPVNKEYNEIDFIVTKANKYGYEAVKNWPGIWGRDPYPNSLILYAPRRSSKSFIAHIWQKKSNALFINPENFNLESIDSSDAFIIEDIEKLDMYEEKLLHIFNLINEKKKYLLLTASSLVKLPFKLTDLSSRIKSLYNISLDGPDDELIKIMLIRHFSARSLKIDISVINYIITRIERNFDAIANIVEVIDKSSLTQKRKITIPFVKNILENLSL